MKKQSKKGLVLSFEERLIISKGIKKYYSLDQLAESIERSPSSIYREMAKNGGYKNYNPIDAQKQSDIEKENHNEKRKINIIKYNEKRKTEKKEFLKANGKGNSLRYEERKEIKRLSNRIDNLEFQLEILIDTIKGLKANDKKD